MRTRTSTLLVAGLLALGLAVLAIVVPVPLVALGPGPTFNTLGKVDGKPVITVQGLPTYPPSGNLNITTVSVTDHLTLVGVLRQWAAADRQVVPRSAVFTPGMTDEQVQEKNAQDFSTSEIERRVGRREELGLPTVVASPTSSPESAADGKLQVGRRSRRSTAPRSPTPAAVNNAAAGHRRPGEPRPWPYRATAPPQTRHAHAGRGRGLAARACSACCSAVGRPRTATSRSTSAAWAARRPG